MFGCADFSYRKMKQALKSVFGKGVRMKESMEVILLHSSWGLHGFLSRSKQFKGRLGQKPHIIPKTLSHLVRSCGLVSLLLPNLWILMLEAIEGCWGGLIPCLWG